MEITNQFVTYQEVLDGDIIENDPYQLTRTSDEKKRTFLSNPNLTDYTQKMYILKRVDGVVGGFRISYPTKFKAGNEIFNSVGGCSLTVKEEFRHLGIGADILLYSTMNKEDKYLLYAGISEMALPMYKKLRFNIFKYPSIWQPRNTRFLFQTKGCKGFALSSLSFLGNCILKPFLLYVDIKSRQSRKGFRIEQLNAAPEWITSMTLNDGHKYTEVHDKAWFDWTLNNIFHAYPENVTKLFGIYKGEIPVGFFMTKERLNHFEEKHIDRLIFGSVVEWGTADEKTLSEKQIIKMALNTFSKNVDIVTYASTNEDAIKYLKRLGFVHHGFANVVFKDKTKSLSDVGDVKQWRIRSSFSDVIFF